MQFRESNFRKVDIQCPLFHNSMNGIHKELARGQGSSSPDDDQLWIKQIDQPDDRGSKINASLAQKVHAKSILLSGRLGNNLGR